LLAFVVARVRACVRACCRYQKEHKMLTAIALCHPKEKEEKKGAHKIASTHTVPSVFFRAKFRQNAKNKIETRIF
jgi:hypothetical protein